MKPLGICQAELVAQVSARNRILFEASELQHDGRLNLALQNDRSTHLLQVASLLAQQSALFCRSLGRVLVKCMHTDARLSNLLPSHFRLKQLQPCVQHELPNAPE